MIIDTIVGIFLDLLGGIIGLLPDEPAPPDLVEKVDQGFGWMDLGGPGDDALTLVDEWFPLVQLALCIVAIGIWMLAIHALRLLSWLLCLVHVGGTDA